MVPPTRRAAGVAEIFQQHRHLVGRVHIRRDVQHEAAVPGAEGRGRADADLQDRRHSDERNMAGALRHATVEELRVRAVPSKKPRGGGAEAG